MDTEYKPGIWYGWNGGECPVHPKTQVQVVWQFSEGDIRAGKVTGLGSEWAWAGNDHGQIVAFCVVKEHRQPRELWHLLDEDGGVFDTFTDKEQAERGSSAWLHRNLTLVHYREVMDGAE